MKKVSLKDEKSIICERCGAWNKSETDHKTHLNTTCNVHLPQVELNQSFDERSSTQPSLALGKCLSNTQLINQQQTSGTYKNLVAVEFLFSIDFYDLMYYKY